MALEILKKLIQYPTITPLEHGIYDYIKTLLPSFEAIYSEKGGVKNIMLYRIPKDCNATKSNLDSMPHFCFAGHIDVVHPGGGAIIPKDINDNKDNEYNKGSWKFPPFTPTINNGYIYGRGTQDMKGGIACFLRALKDFLEHNNPQIIFSILLTSDEEGDGIYGTKYMLEILKNKNMLPTHAIVAEPTSTKFAGDTIKVGRRGSINGIITIEGKQGHVAYPEKCNNPVELLGDKLGKLAGVYLDSGDDVFSASKLVITDIRGGIEAVNVTPNDLRIMFNVRNSTMTTLQSVREYVDSVLIGLPYTLELTQSSKSFVTKDNTLISLVQNAIYEATKTMPELSTSGGTSDARFFSEYGVKVVEVGVCNDRIHAIDERVSLNDIERLQNIFSILLQSLNHIESKNLLM